MTGAELLDGKALARQVRAELETEVKAAAEAAGRPPGLAVVLVGEDPASAIYVGRKEKLAGKAGIRSFSHRLPAETTQEELEALLDELGSKDEVDGILVQLPLPGHLDSDRALLRIPAEKDVDGLTPVSLGRLAQGDEHLVPCTPRGVIRMLDTAGFEYSGAKALVIGRSRLVGKPMAYLLTNRNATVTIAHSRTKDLPALVGQSELVVAAVGRKGMVQGSWLKLGAWVVDVGIHRNDDGTLAGDVAPDARDRAAKLTPVPGGVGPMTIAMLLENTFLAFQARVAGPA